MNPRIKYQTWPRWRLLEELVRLLSKPEDESVGNEPAESKPVDTEARVVARRPEPPQLGAVPPV